VELPIRAGGDQLDAMLIIAVRGVTCGAERWSDTADFGRPRRGIPSDDTFGRVFACLDPDAFERFFTAWDAAIADDSSGELFAAAPAVIEHRRVTPAGV
jgi:hypothetical protein